MVRKGAVSDIDSIISMASEFWGHTIYDEGYCPETIEAMASLCIEQELMSVLEVDGEVVGFACGVKGTLLGNCNVTSGTEIAWWVNPDNRSGRSGIALLKHIEGLAKDAGIKHWNMAFMVSSMPEQIEAIYIKMGYTKTEIIYSKVL